MGFGATGGAASQALNGVMSALDQQATLQQQRQKAQQAQSDKDSKDHMEALNQGAIPLDALDNSNGAPSNRPTLMKPQDLQPGQDPNRVQEIGGKRFYFPTEEEKAKAKAKPEKALDETNSVLFPDDVNSKLGMAPGTRHPIEHAGGIYDLFDKVNKAGQRPDRPVDRVDLSGDFKDGDGNPIPVAIYKDGSAAPLDTSAFGSPAIQQPAVGTVTPAPASGLTQPITQPKPQGTGISFSPKKPADKPEKEGLDHWVSVATDPDSSPDEVKRAKAAINLHNSNTAGALAAARKLADAQNEKPLSPSAARQITQKKFNDLKSADTAYAKANAEAVTPEEKQSALAARQQARQNAQLDYEQSISAATGKDIPHNSWADNPASPAPSGGSAAPATAAKPAQATPRTATAPAPATPNAPGKKVASIATVRAYAKKNNLSEAAAIRAAKGEGFQIAGQ